MKTTRAKIPLRKVASKAPDAKSSTSVQTIHTINHVEIKASGKNEGNQRGQSPAFPHSPDLARFSSEKTQSDFAALPEKRTSADGGVGSAGNVTLQAESEFNKTFSLKTGWPLPRVDDMYAEPRFELDGLRELKTALNRTKEKLDSFDMDQWHAHTSKMNPAGLVIDHVQKHVRPDFLTQAWCKFYEIASGAPLRLRQEATADGELRSVHLGEAPGAFVSSLNHFLAVDHRGRSRLRWLAMTLNPYHEANGRPNIIADDRLIVNTLDNWEFGPDYTGDIFQTGYPMHLRRTVRRRFGGEAGLVTADGSIDCSDDPGEQETAVMRLHDHECMVALNVLRDGGSLVLKMFTAFECGTVCRTYLLCCLFRSVVFRKPATSKPGNSEVYAVCAGYAGRSAALPYVRKFFESDGSATAAVAMFPASQIPEEFRAALLECTTYFAGLQIRTIEASIDAWSPDRRERRYREMAALQRSVCRLFVDRCGLRPIRRDQGLMPVHRFRPGVRTDGGRRRGASYGETARFEHPDPRRQAEALYRAVTERDGKDDPRSRDAFWGERGHLTVRLSDVRFRLGKPVVAVRGSKFCDETLVHCRLRALAQFPRVEGGTDARSRSRHYRAALDRPDMTVCDLTEVYRDRSVDHVTRQHRCLRAITGALRGLTASADLAIVGYPLFTQTSVGCFFAVASMFEKHGMTRPDPDYGHAFVFYNYACDDGWHGALDRAKRLLLPENNNDHLALVSWLPIRVLMEQNAYPEIVAINNACIVHEIGPVLASFLNYSA